MAAPKKAAANELSKKKTAPIKAATLSRKYIALENIQRSDSVGLKFYLFHAPASEIFQWGLIDRMSPENPKAIQRKLNRTKILRIKEFLDYPGNTIATSVVVVFGDDAVDFKKSSLPDGTSGFGALTIAWRPDKPAGIIVDGQHRVIGANEYSEDIYISISLA
jgi:DGQHR domain-containing protein